jgi:hypothetical protein
MNIVSLYSSQNTGEQCERSVKGRQCTPMRKYLTHFIEQCYAAGKVTNGHPFS